MPVKEVTRKEFIKSMSRYYLGAFQQGIKYFIVTNQKSFNKGFMVVEPAYMAHLLERSEHLEDNQQAKEIQTKLEEIKERVSANSRKRANSRWQ